MRRKTGIVLRVLVGAILVATGIGKLVDVPGFARVLFTYDAFAPGALLPIAIAIAAAELLLGFWLFSGRRPFAACLAALAMHLVYAGWSAAALLRGLKLANCGCFGVFLPRPLGWSTVYEDLAVAGVCAVAAALSPRGGAA